MTATHCLISSARVCRQFALALLLTLPAFLFATEGTPALQALWKERIKSVVAVEFYVETEIERRPSITGGTVIDREGTVILHGPAIPLFLPPSHVKDLRVYLPGKPTSDFSRAEYLGPDMVTGWHFIRVDAAMRSSLVPITEFVSEPLPSVSVTDEVWGIGLRGKDEDFEPYFLSNRVGLIATLPQRSAVALASVTAPQLPVFNQAGSFVGLGLAGFGETYYQYSRTERGTPLLLVSGDEARVFRLADEIVPYFKRIPKAVSGRPVAWLGVMGLQPLPADVAKYLNLENQSALVVSEVLEGGPAEKAGVKERDVIVSVNGKVLPRLRPAQVATGWMEREVALRSPGDKIKLTILRGTERMELEATLADEPRMLREAERKYFDRIGFSVREFLYVDMVGHRIKESERSGVVANFVKSNSPAASAGLRAEDWIREIDGVEIKSLADAISKLEAIEKDTARAEFVILTSRGGETSVMRVKLR